jgi:hypothetical protein
VSVVDRLLAALNAGDIDAFVGCYAKDATIENGEDTVLVSGHVELRERYGRMFEAAPQIRIEALGRWVAGPYVVQEEEVTGRGPEAERHVAVYQLRDGVIVRERLLR